MIPNDDSKYGSSAVFSPEEAVDAHGDGLPELPPAIILGFQTELTEAVREQADERIEIVRSQYCLPISESVGYVPVHEWGIGAPIAATVTENVIAAGATAVVLLGGCACLQPDVPTDAAVLPTEAIRDEGVSHHYLPSEESVTPTTSLVDTLEESLSAAGFDTPRGPTWTTSAMYRETTSEVEQYREQGVISLCMESAALWAVCEYRDVDTATVHGVGDYLAPDEWTPRVDDDYVLPDQLEPTVKALERHVGNA